MTTIAPLTDSTAEVGTNHVVQVQVTSGTGPFNYLWTLNGVSDGTQNTDTFTLQATEANSYSTLYVTVSNDSSENVTSETILLISQTAQNNMTRHALHWRYDDNTFHWADIAVEIEGDPGSFSLYDVSYQTFGFEPGFQERWTDYSAITWADAKQGGANEVRWSDTFSIGENTEVLQLANGMVYAAEKINNRSQSLKRYYATRTQIDLDDLVPEWTTNKVKQIKQFIFHMQSDSRLIVGANDIDYYVGWSQNLMADPNWEPGMVVDLREIDDGGDYKIDYRTSGRYLAYSFDLTDSQQLALTGGDIDANQVAGR